MYLAVSPLFGTCRFQPSVKEQVSFRLLAPWRPLAMLSWPVIGTLPEAEELVGGLRRISPPHCLSFLTVVMAPTQGPSPRGLAPPCGFRQGLEG